MKIVVLHWHTSSVGGINTTLQTLHKEAQKVGDTFHVFACNNQKTKKPLLYGERKSVSGGDTKIVIDGELPHHLNNFKESSKFLKDNGYDVVMTSFLCPHPTKEYGNEPDFEMLLKEISKNNIPLIGYIHDAYWDTYKSFGEVALQYMEKTILNQKAYSNYFNQYPQYRFELAFVPFVDLSSGESNVKRNPKKVAWLPQWKPIKGINKFIEGLQKAQGLEIDLYGNGIEYYYIRKELFWNELINDHFSEKHGNEKASINFYGCVPAENIASILSEASFMCDFQGHSAKYSAYLNGSYNHTILEALYFGCVPVVHTNMKKSGIPNDLLLAIDDVKNWQEAVLNYDLTKFDKEKARKYVEENHNSTVLYNTIFEEFRRIDFISTLKEKVQPIKKDTLDDF